MNKAKINYWVDVVTALAFILSAVSGIVFLFPINGSTVLGIAYNIWDQIHTWGSLLMIAGVMVHLILHWKWIVAMTGKILFPPAKPVHSTAAAGGALISRRRFLRTAGLGIIGLGAAGLGAAMTALSYKSLFGSKETVARPTVPPTAAPAVLTEENQAIVGQQPEATSVPVTDTPTAASVPTEENQAMMGQQSEATSVPATGIPTATPVPTEETNEVVIQQPEATNIPPTVIPTQSLSVATSAQTFSVACPKGITYDPYPGHCRHYVDKDGDGYCDLSIPTAN